MSLCNMHAGLSPHAALQARATRRVAPRQAHPLLRSRRHCPPRAHDRGSGGKPSNYPDASFICSVKRVPGTSEAEAAVQASGWAGALQELFPSDAAPLEGRPCSFRVKCLHHGKFYRLDGLPTQRHADQAADLLSIKAASEAGQSLDGLVLRSRAQQFRPFGELGCPLVSSSKPSLYLHFPWHSGDELTEAGRLELTRISFQELFSQIESWVEGLLKWDVKPTLLYQAASAYESSLIGARLLLLLDPASASAADAPRPGAYPLGMASRRSNTKLVELLLQAAPHMARVPDDKGCYPIHQAADWGPVPTLRLLLQAAPETAGAAFRSSRAVAAVHGKLLARGDMSRPTGIQQSPERQLEAQTPLHLAAFAAPKKVALLIEAAPEAAMQPDIEGRLPLHCAATTGCEGAVQLLLAAAPEAALCTASPSYMTSQLERLRACGVLRSRRAPQAQGPAGGRLTPLHIAAFRGMPGAVRELLAAAPRAAAMEDHHGCTPLQLALAGLAGKDELKELFSRDHRGAVRVLLNACSMPDAAEALLAAGPEAWPLFGDLVAARLPLAEAEWALLPTPCPALLPFLPAVLAHSLQQARQLVRRLPRAEKRRLHAAALSLGQERQQDVRTRLPVAAAQELLFEQLHVE